jgi:hypothetical protein
VPAQRSDCKVGLGLEDIEHQVKVGDITLLDSKWCRCSCKISQAFLIGEHGVEEGFAAQVEKLINVRQQIMLVG